MSSKPSTKSAGKRRATQNDTAAAGNTEQLKNPEPIPPQSRPRRPPYHTRRELTANFLDVLCTDFEAHGADAIRACREDQPQGYLRLVASLLPNEFDPNENLLLKDIPDGDIDRLIEYIRACLVRINGDSPPAGGELSPSHG
jgi:hypothetical protein